MCLSLLVCHCSQYSQTGCYMAVTLSVCHINLTVVFVDSMTTVALIVGLLAAAILVCALAFIPVVLWCLKKR